LFPVNPALHTARAGFTFSMEKVMPNTNGTGLLSCQSIYPYEKKSAYAEFLPALMIPNEQRIANFSYTSFTGVLTSCSSSSLILVSAYC
jgi:hypothetical protein